LQAGANIPGNLKNVEKLVTHPAFAISNPNACYSLFLSFLRSPVNFHAADGSGYNFFANSILKVSLQLWVDTHTCLALPPEDYF
jgi:aminopeptidase N